MFTCLVQVPLAVDSKNVAVVEPFASPGVSGCPGPEWCSRAYSIVMAGLSFF